MKIKKIFDKLRNSILKNNMVETIISSTEVLLTKKNLLYKDYMLISKNFVVKKINELLDDNIVVICDLHDRNGKIGLSISKIENDMDSENSILYLNNQSTHKLSDKYLYNLIYNIKTDKYYLEEHDEYFEKIEVE
jgi:hypothetical protein